MPALRMAEEEVDELGIIDINLLGIAGFVSCYTLIYHFAKIAAEIEAAIEASSKAMRF